MRDPGDIVFEVPAAGSDTVFGNESETYELVEIDSGKLFEMVGGSYSEKLDKFECYLRKHRNVKVSLASASPADGDSE